jgi:thioredoxin 2
MNTSEFERRIVEKENCILKCNKCGTKNRIPKSRLNAKPICGKCRNPLSTKINDHPIDITDNSFNEEVLEASDPVLLDCWAPWCGPCRMVAPVLEQIAKEYSGRVKIAKLNVDENPVTASKYSIQSIPTMLMFINGKLINTIVGALPKNDIEKHILSML